MGVEMKNIFFVAPNRSSFVNKDIEILEKNASVYFVQSTAFNIIDVIISQFSLFIKLILNLKKADLYYIWFADYHSFLPVLFSKLFKKKSILVIGGSDVNYLPEYGIGNVIGPLGVRKASVVYSLNNASLLLPVDESLIYTENNYAAEKSQAMGINYFSHNKNIEVLPTSIDIRQWKSLKKKKQFITIVSFSNKKRLIQKGFDLFLQLATELKEFEFYLVGGKKSIVEKNFEIPKNLIVKEFLNHDELSNLLSETKVFLLLSLSEGMPNVLIEAMASGCIPIVSNVNGMPDLAKKHGYVLENKNLDVALELCRKAIEKPESIHDEIEKEIKEKFNLENRELAMKQIISDVI
jgi:glycosyltransferase involved in cell wall biosynthesis